MISMKLLNRSSLFSYGDSAYSGIFAIAAMLVLPAGLFGCGSSGPSSFGGAGFNNPGQLAADNNAMIYVADTANHRIVRVADIGAGIESFGSQGSGPGQFLNPEAVAVDDANRIYIADTGNHRIVRIDNMSGANWTAFGTQ